MRRAAIFLAVSLLVAACSSGDDPGDPTDAAESSDAAGVTDTAESTPTGDESQASPGGSPDASPDPTSGAASGDGATGSGTPTSGATDEFVELPGLTDMTNDPIPNDEAVLTGVLDNGLRYYIRSNDNPGGKADLRLAVRAGSVDEFAPPSGVAHFLEHMLFNGTERFPENELISVLRSFGASFGPDVNAYTSYDETVYSLVVPATDDAVRLGLDVLAEWLSAATIDADAVVAERGVVLDEWRVRTQSTDGRLLAVAADMYLADTPYAGRMPIGTSTSIGEMVDGDLRPFYDAWYRPDNVAVIAVGDIDVDEIEGAIAERFADVTARADAPERPDTSFALDTEPDFRLHSDPDQITVDVEVTLPLPAYDADGTATDRAALIDYMVYDILVRRLAGDVASGTAPFDDIGPGTNSIVTGLDAPALYAFTDADRVDATLDELLDEYGRAFRYGFTQPELDTARASLVSIFRSRYDGRASTQDRDYADAYVEHYLRGTPYPAIAAEYEIAIDLLDGITTEALDTRFDARWTNSAPHVIIATPESQVDRMPDRFEVLAAIERATERDLPPREPRRDLPEVLMDRPEAIEPASIATVLDEAIVAFDPVEIAYPNGVRVRLNPNEIVKGQVFLEGGSPGGSSLVGDDDVPDALYAADIVTSSGVADLDQAELVQFLAGSDVDLGAYLTPYEERLFGSMATSDAELFFQLVHLYLTEPRTDEVALNQVIAAERPVVADPSIDPRAAGIDALLDARYDDEPRYTLLPTLDQFDTLDLEGVERVWDDRFGDVSDWVFVFSGDFELDSLVDLSSSYLATLPGTGRVDEPVDVSAPPPSSVEAVSVSAGTGETATLTFLFTAEVDDVTSLLRVEADVTTAVLRARLSEVIREEFGESYSPYADSYVEADPGPVVETYIEISGAPDRLGLIADLVLAELADLAETGPTPDEFASAYAEVEEAYNFNSNGEFLDVLLDDAIVPSLPLSGYLGEYGSLFEVTAANVRDYVMLHVPVDAYVQVTVTPR